MEKKKILLTLLGLLPLLLGGKKGALAAAIAQMMVNGPVKKLATRGVTGYVVAMGITFLIPFVLKRIFPSSRTT